MKRYWRFVLPAAVIAVIIAILLVTLQSNLVFFTTPTELLEQSAGEDRMRLGGEVVVGSVVAEEDGVLFTVTDGRETVGVAHRGTPQDLFQEGVGVVVEGTWDGRLFHSDSMIVSHDEQYRTEDGEVYEPGAGVQTDS